MKGCDCRMGEDIESPETKGMADKKSRRMKCKTGGILVDENRDPKCAALNNGEIDSIVIKMEVDKYLKAMGTK